MSSFCTECKSYYKFFIENFFPEISCKYDNIRNSFFPEGGGVGGKLGVPRQGIQTQYPVSVNSMPCSLNIKKEILQRICYESHLILNSTKTVICQGT